MSSPNSHPGSNTPGGPDGPSRRARLSDLLADRAVQGLSAAEEAELQLLLADLNLAGDESLELAAAAASVAMIGAERQALSSELRAKLEEAAESFARGQKQPMAEAKPRLALTPLLEQDRQANARAGTQRREPSRPAIDWRVVGGWLTAAACLCLAAVAWITRPAAPPAPSKDIVRVMQPAPAGGAPTVTPPIVAVTPSQPLNAAAGVMSLSEGPEKRMEELRAGGADFVTIAMQRMDGAGGAQTAVGEIVWFPTRQEGFLDLRGLPPIEAPGDQYQLWVFDALRDDRFPVDGGVFSVPAGQRHVVLPFATRLAVSRATHFAVTIERAGGVVVSNRDRLVLAGRVDDSGPLVPGMISLSAAGSADLSRNR